MTRPARIVIKSKKHTCNLPLRKPVKECYCYQEYKKEVDSAKLCCNVRSSCDYCKSRFDISIADRRENNENEAVATPLSCETLRKIQEIDYIPKSQFLRNIQSKASLLHKSGSGENISSCSKLHTSKASLTTQTGLTVEKGRLEERSQERLDNATRLYRIVPPPAVNVHSFVEQQKSVEVQKCDKGVQTCPSMLETPARRTVASKKTIAKGDEKKESVNTRCKLFRVPRRSLEKKVEEDEPCPEHCSAGWCINRGKENSDVSNLSDSEIQEIRKFRERNYFDTHGSSHTLARSDSSGSLEQYMLNERLFPEFVKKIHKEDLVVTMPPCATKQRKRLHYFPKSVVRQEKTAANTNYTRKRFLGCPLTGHALDLGIFKTDLPTNSLALKYQKKAAR